MKYLKQQLIMHQKSNHAPSLADLASNSIKELSETFLLAFCAEKQTDTTSNV